ncbi:MAG: GNAT family N-acetyltransferase [Bacteroidota bacterium]
MKSIDSLFPQTNFTPQRDRIIIREVVPTDAKAILAYLRIVAGETDFLSVGPDEVNLPEEPEIQYIESHQTTPNQLFLLAEVREEIAGILNINARQKARMAHIGELGLSLRRSYWGKGIAFAIMQTLIHWAQTNEITREINLHVLLKNERTIRS